jgi:hypothetical protein
MKVNENKNKSGGRYYWVDLISNGIQLGMQATVIFIHPVDVRVFLNWPSRLI